MQFRHRENPQDEINENEIGDIIRKRFECDLVKLPRGSQIDFAASRNNEIKAFIEVKQRNFEMNKYPTTRFFQSKIEAAEKIQRLFGVPSYIVIRWTDCVGYATLNKRYPTSIWGRTDRNDPLDMNTGVKIPISEITILEVFNDRLLA